MDGHQKKVCYYVFVVFFKTTLIASVIQCLGDVHAGSMQRLVDVRVGLNRRPHHSLVAMLSGNMQGHLAFILRLVDVRARFNQRSHYRIASITSGDVWRCQTIIIRSDVCAR
tara:strand:+ start:6054 stop:6389 length:336 start_codon:yes stop_codon:yes gene_type:complete